MKNLKVSDVDSLCGLSLCVAYAIYVEGWAWYEFPGHDVPRLLLDAPLPTDKTPDKECARYVGGEYYVFKEMAKYDESIMAMLSKGKTIVQSGYGWEYSRAIEKEIKSSNHIRLLHVPSDKRCRAILKLFLENPEIKDVIKEL